MKIWLTTDTHFNHDKMVELCGRPKNFEDLIYKHLKKIPKEDVLIHLGDICMGDDSIMHKKYIEPLVCKKWLIRGNHDKKSVKWYLDHGWDFVGEQIIIKLFGKDIVFSHKPIQKIDICGLNIHGHFHNSKHRDAEFENFYYEGFHKLLAIEYTNFQPVILEKFINI